MSSPSDNQQDNELYEFNSDYLEELNRIRRQFNLEEIRDEPQNEPLEDVPIPEAVPTSSQPELYEFDTSYINDLNAVRRRFNLTPIRLETKDKSEGKPPPVKKVSIEIETLSDYTSSEDVEEETIHSYKERGKSSEYATEESSTVTSTTHGIQSPFSIPDEEQSEPITPKVTILSTAIVYHHQKSISRNKIEPLDLRDSTSSTSESTQVGNAKSPLSSVRDATIRTSLDLPRKSVEEYDFPNIVDISKWLQNLTKDVDLERICSVKPLGAGDKKKICGKSCAADSGYRQKAEEMLQEPVPNDIDTVSSLSNMNRCKQSVDMKFYDVESQTTKSDQAESDDAAEGSNSRCCDCFRMCFVKKRKKYFS